MTGKGKIKSRYKRLSRLLSNTRFQLIKAMHGLVTFGGVTHLQGLIAVLIDQTSLCNDNL